MTMSTSKKVTVFLIRHGERDDLVKRRNGIYVPLEDRLDPVLTSKGYEQARLSFERLLAGLKKDGRQRKIGVFCSPTRSMIGTALTLSVAGAKSNRKIQWGFQKSDSDESIPIVVLNGLCGCAACVVKLGGASRVIQHGLLPCADIAANDASRKSPIVNAIANMQESANEKLHCQTTECLQFCRIQEGSCVPMTPPLSALSSQVQDDVQRSTEQEPLQQGSAPAAESGVGQMFLDPASSHEDFYESLHRAMVLAQEDGCDTVIVVAHREAIHGLAKQWGSNGRRVVSPYCCIASYIAEVSETECLWELCGVADYTEFDESWIPNL